MNSPECPRMLFVTPVSPFKTAAGSEQRSHLMLQALRQHHTVDVLELSEGTALEARPAQETEGLLHVVMKVPTQPQVWRRFEPQDEATALAARSLGRALDSYALVVGRYLWPMAQLRLPPSARTLVDLDDWHFRLDRAAWGDPRAIKQWLRKTAARWLAARALKRMSGAFAVSEPDRREISRLLPTTLLPNVVLHTPMLAQPSSTTPRLLFVGSLWYEPNEQAIDWFLTRVWPQVRTAVPQAAFRIIGAGPAALRERWERHPGVSAPGFAGDLAIEYADATGVVAPILSGGGSNIKVIEALAFGKACVVTKLVEDAFSGLLVPERHYLAGPNARAFAEHCITALTQRDRVQALGHAGRNAVLHRLVRERFVEIATKELERSQ